MTLKDLLTDTQRDIIKRARNTANDMVVITEKLATADMPFEEHRQKAHEQKAWFDKMSELFEIP